MEVSSRQCEVLANAKARRNMVIFAAAVVVTPGAIPALPAGGLWEDS